MKDYSISRKQTSVTCFSIDTTHKHRRLDDAQIEIENQCQRIPLNIKKDAKELYNKMHSSSQIYEFLENKYGNLPFNQKKLKNFLNGISRKQTRDFSIDSFIHKQGNLRSFVREKRKKNAEYLSAPERLESWNLYHDLLIIDSTYKIDHDCKCAIVIITVDSFGGNFLLALAITKNETEKDYKGAFKTFKRLGFNNPEAIIVDRLPAQLAAMKKCFGFRIHVIFCGGHIKRNIIAAIGEDRFNQISEAFYMAYHSKTPCRFGL